jgi:hypothetical protein
LVLLALLLVLGGVAACRHRGMPPIKKGSRPGPPYSYDPDCPRFLVQQFSQQDGAAVLGPGRTLAALEFAAKQVGRRCFQTFACKGSGLLTIRGAFLNVAFNATFSTVLHWRLGASSTATAALPQQHCHSSTAKPG